LHLTVNASADTVLSPEFPVALKGLPLERIVVEITEHTEVEDYECLLQALQPLRQRGLK